MRVVENIAAHLDDMPRIVVRALGNQAWNGVSQRGDRIEALSVGHRVLVTWKRLPQLDNAEVAVEIDALSGISEDKGMTDLMTNLIQFIKMESERCWGI